ncbi:MAG TPA: hypothetical protein PKV71_13610, partial [Calditrichia bacterium]|nr:hypothetical protein [Calditrichia bacterium]
MLSRLMPGILVLGLSYAALLAQPTTLRILALRVEFQTDANPATTGNGRFDLSFPTDPYQIDPPPHNRTYFNDHFLFARNYFEKASRGNLLIEADVFPRGRDEAYQLSRQMGEYNPNTSPQAINQGVAELLRDAVMAADADPLVDFSRYQAVVVFHAGVGRDINLGFDETPQDIPSLYVTSSFLQENLGIDGIPVDGGAITIRSGVVLPETESQEGLQLGLNGILVSNIGSVLGFSDLFSPSEGSSGIGRFGLMDAGLFNGDGLLPAQPCAWTRLEAGWATSETIYQAQGDQFTVRHAGSQAGTTVFRLPINEREYFLVENRYAGGVSLDSVQFVLSQNRNEFVSMKEALQTALPGSATFSDSSGVLTDIDLPDRGLPGSGILIWHIDESVIDANRAENRINDDPDHRGVDLEEADGSQDIGESFEIVSGGAGSEIGTLLDFWFADNPADVFVRDPAGEFSLNSIPDSRSYLN